MHLGLQVGHRNPPPAAPPSSLQVRQWACAEPSWRYREEAGVGAKMQALSKELNKVQRQLDCRVVVHTHWNPGFGLAAWV